MLRSDWLPAEGANTTTMITLSVVLNMYVPAVINYGIGHLSESVKQTNILNVPNRCLKHV